MAAQTVVDTLALMKEVFATDEPSKQFDEGTFLLDIIEKGDMNSPQAANMMAEYDGKYVIFPLYTTPNPNTAVGTLEGRGYPLEGGSTFAQAKYRAKYIVSSYGFTSQLMSRARGNPQSVLNYVASEAERLLASTRRQMDFYLHGDGSGLLAVSASYDNTNSILTVGSTANLKVGQEIMLRHLSSGATTGTAQQGTIATGWDIVSGEYTPARITALTATTATLVYSGNSAAFGNLTVNSNHGVFAWDAQGQQIWGLDAFCEDANPGNAGFNAATTVTATDETGLLRCLGAIDRTVSTNSFWNAYATQNLAGAAISLESHIQPLQVGLIQRDSTLMNTEDVYGLLTHQAWWNLINQMESGKRTEVRKQIIDGKYEVVKYGIFTFGFSLQQPANTAYFFCPKNLFRMVTTPWGFEDMAGSQYQNIAALGTRRPTSKWRANLFTEQQLCANSVLGFGKFTNTAG